MAVTGKEVGRVVTSGAIALLLGLLAILLLGGSRDRPTTSPDDGGPDSSLELLPVEPTAGPTAPTTPTTPTTRPSTTAPTERPAPSETATTPARALPSATTGPRPTTTPRPTVTAAPTTAPPVVVVVTPTATPVPTTTPAGRITATSPLPPGCGTLGAPCRYPDAPAGARLSDGPRSVTVTPSRSGSVLVTASPGSGASPASVGFVVRVCRCTGPVDDVLLEVRLSTAPGSALELQTGTRDLRVWVQELNEAGLSRGVFQDVLATPTPTATATPEP